MFTTSKKKAITQKDFDKLIDLYRENKLQLTTQIPIFKNLLYNNIDFTKLNDLFETIDSINFSNCEFDNCNFTNVKFENCVFDNSTFNTVFYLVSFNRCSLAKVDVESNSAIIKSSFKDCVSNHLTFYGVSIKSSSFVNTSLWSLRDGCLIDATYFRDCDNVNMFEANILNTELFKIKNLYLEGVSFRNSTIRDSDLLAINLHSLSSSLEHSKISAITESIFLNTNFTTCNFKNDFVTNFFKDSGFYKSSFYKNQHEATLVNCTTSDCKYFIEGFEI